MEDFNLKGYLAENKLIKENITQFEEYIDGLFNASVDQEAEEGFQTGVWTKEEEGNPELYDETEKFDALVDYLANIGGKATLEGNPDINVELLDNGDIKWNADVTLTENNLVKENIENVRKYLYDYARELDQEGKLKLADELSKHVQFLRSDMARD